MTEEHKELLLKDLCTRLPYGVKVHAKYIDTDIEIEKVGVLSMVDNDTVIAFTCDDMNCYNYVAIHEVKPYLFPLSSMTEEQKVIYGDLCYAVIHSLVWDMQAKLNELVDWLDAHHFDYRGLIPMGLAIDATNLNIY